METIDVGQVFSHVSSFIHAWLTGRQHISVLDDIRRFERLNARKLSTEFARRAWFALMILLKILTHT